MRCRSRPLLLSVVGKRLLLSGTDSCTLLGRGLNQGLLTSSIDSVSASSSSLFSDLLLDCRNSCGLCSPSLCDRTLLSSIDGSPGILHATLMLQGGLRHCRLTCSGDSLLLKLSSLGEHLIPSGLDCSVAPGRSRAARLSPHRRDRRRLRLRRLGR